MASTYSSNLKIELMGTGENSGTWGSVTNTNLGTTLEQAVIGLGNPDYTSDANLTITLTDSNASQAARCLVLNVTSAFGSLTATRELIVPTNQKQYIVQNNTTGGQSITVKTSAGTGITVPNGRKAHLYVNGTNVIQMFDFVDINGGTIDGATVGAASASTGAFTSLTASGATTLNGAVALGDAAGDLITVPGTVNSNLIFTDNSFDIGASGATRPRDLFLAGAATVGGNLSVGGTLTLTGGVNLNGNVTVGDASTDTLTINSTITSNLIFTDNTYDIGASGATRPRSLFLAGNITAAGNQTLTGALTVDSTTDSSSTTTGSIQTDGGVGIAKALFVGTTVTAATLNLTNALGTIYGGTGLTSFASGDIMYYTSGTAMSKLTLGTAGQLLTVNSGATAPQWTSGSSVTVGVATNVAGGVAGSVPYQSGASTTTFLGIGTAGQILTVNSGATAPQWSTLTGVAVTTFSAGTTGFTPSTATSGAITLAGTLVVSNGGTGLTSLTAGYIPFGAGTSAFGNTANLFWDNTNGRLGIGTTNPARILELSTATPAIAFRASGQAVDQKYWEFSVAGTVLRGAVQNDANSTEAFWLEVQRGAGNAITSVSFPISNVGIGTSSPTSGLQTAGSSSKSAFRTPNIAEVDTISATAATGTINYDITTQSVLFYTSNASANWTVNFRGSSGTSLNTLMQTGESISATFLVTQGATAYYNSAVTIDGVSVTPKWQGGTAPTSGNASSVDSYTYVIQKTGSATYVVLAAQTKFA